MLPPKESSQFSTKVRELCSLYKITGDELAKNSKISKTTLYFYINKNNTTHKVLTDYVWDKINNGIKLLIKLKEYEQQEKNRNNKTIWQPVKPYTKEQLKELEL